MKYSFLREDEKAFHLMHPNGESFQVAKKGIDAEMHDKIRAMVPKHMSDGGMVKPLPVDSANAASFDSDMASQPDIAAPVNPFQGSKVINETPDTFSLQDAGGKDVTLKKSDLGPAQWAQINSLDEAPSNPVKAPAAKAPVQTQEGTPELTQTVSENKIPLTQVPPEREISRTPTDPFSQEELGVKQQKLAEQQLGKQSALSIGKAENSIADAAALFQKNMAVQNERNAKLTQAYESGHIDPNRVFANMSTGNKVMAGIGMILGGLGGGALGTGQNDALKVINNAIDRDIDAQKAAMDKSRNLIAQNFEQTHNIEQAHLMTKNDILGALEVNIKKLAANAATPMAEGKANMLVGQIEQLRLKNNQAIAEKMLPSLLTGGKVNTKGLNPEMLPEHIRERAVKLPNGDIGLVTNKEDAKEVKGTLASLGHIDDEITKSISFINTVGRTVGATVTLPQWLGGGKVGIESAKNAVADSMRRSIFLELNKLHGLNRLTDTELHEFKQMVDSPGAWRQDKSLAKLVQLRDFVKSKRNSELSQKVSNYQEPGEIPSLKKGFR